MFPWHGAADRRDPNAPDLQTQLEAMFSAVWEYERNWQLDDLIDLREGVLPSDRRADHGRWT